MFDEEAAIDLPYDDIPNDYVPPPLGGEPLGGEPEQPSELNGSLEDRLAPPSRVYSFAHANTAVRSTIGKLKGVSQGEVPEETAMDSMDLELGYRENAIRLQGDPISHLTTDQIFAYVVKFATAPVGLEWVNDTTCVIIFTSATLARAAQRFLLKSQDNASDTFDPLEEVNAKDVPSDCWPPKALEEGNEEMKTALEGPMTVRFAKLDDVKPKFAKEKSMFYYRYGPSAGQDGYVERESRKRRREEEEGTVRRDDRRNELDSELETYLADTPEERAKRRRANLDDELEAYLADDPRNGDEESKARPRSTLISRLSEERPRNDRRSRRTRHDDGVDSYKNGSNGDIHSPPSRFRSDVMPSPQSRARESSPGRRNPDRRYGDRADFNEHRYERLPSDEESWKERRPRRGPGHRDEGGRTRRRPAVNAEQLDAELDAYLNDTA